jgi:hypothetical protein
MSRDRTVARGQRGTNRNPSSKRTSGDTSQGTNPTGEERRSESKDEEPTIETRNDEEEEGEVGAERGLLDDTEDEDEVETITSTEEILRLNVQVKELQEQLKRLTARKITDHSSATDGDVDDEQSTIGEIGDTGIDTGCFRNGPYWYVDNKLTDTELKEKVESLLATSRKALGGKDPWEAPHYKSSPNPEALWREQFTNAFARSKDASKNWECLMEQCHIDEADILLLRRYLDIRELRDITSPDDTTFASDISKMTKSKWFPITAIPCFKALRVWARWFTFIHSRQPHPQDFTPLEAQWACKRYEMEHNLTALLPQARKLLKFSKASKPMIGASSVTPPSPMSSRLEGF